MREDWINDRAKQYYAQHTDWAVAFIKAYADAAREWPLIDEPRYEESQELQEEYQKDLNDEAEAQGVPVSDSRSGFQNVADLLSMRRQS
jgi:hypothetical protein